MVLSHAAKAALKIAAKKRAIAKVHRIRKAVKPRDRRVKKVSKVHKLKKRGKPTIGSATTVGKLHTSTAAKKAAAIKEIRNMNIDRNQGIIIGVQGPIPRQTDLTQRTITTSSTLPNPRTIKIQKLKAKAIEHVTSLPLKKGQNIVVKKGPGEWTQITRRSLTPTEWRKLPPMKGRIRSAFKGSMLQREEITPKYLFGEKVKGIHGKGAAAISRRIKAKTDDITWHHTTLGKKDAIAHGFLAGESIRMPRGLKKAPRTVAGMNRSDWFYSGLGATGVTAVGGIGYELGRQEKEIGELKDKAFGYIKGNIKGNVATGDAAIDVIKERRDQLLRKLGLI